MTSLPVPLSPVMSTVLSLPEITRRKSKTARILTLRPTTTVSLDIGRFGAMRASIDVKRFEIRHLIAQRRLDAQMQRHVSARAANAHAGEANACAVPHDVEELDIAAIRLHEGPQPLEHGFHAFPGDHSMPPRRFFVESEYRQKG